MMHKARYALLAGLAMRVASHPPGRVITHFTPAKARSAVQC